MKLKMKAEIIKKMGELLMQSDEIDGHAEHVFENGHRVVAYTDRFVCTGFVNGKPIRVTIPYNGLSELHQRYLESCIRVNCMSENDFFAPKVIGEA